MEQNDNVMDVRSAVWPWKEAESPAIAGKDDERKKKSIIEASVALTVGALIFAFHSRIMGGIVMCIGTTVLIGGQFVPPVYYAFKKFGLFLAHVIGVGLSWLLLVPFFYICFPVGRLFSLISGKDPMNRKFDKSLLSYWEKHELPKEKGRYEKQY